MKIYAVLCFCDAVCAYNTHIFSVKYFDKIFVYLFIHISNTVVHITYIKNLHFIRNIKQNGDEDNSIKYAVPKSGIKYNCICDDKCFIKYNGKTYIILACTKHYTVKQNAHVCVD